MRLTEQQIQDEQKSRYLMWVNSEGGVERAVHMETYQEPAQLARTKWLVQQVEDLSFANYAVRGMTRSILEIGCSNGHQLLAMNGAVGVDVNPDIIEANQQEHPEKIWLQVDVKSLTWDYPLVPFDCVSLPDVLEHLPYEHVARVIRKAKRLAKKRLLITLPDGTRYYENRRNWQVFKHQWVCTEKKLAGILRVCREQAWQVRSESDGAFIKIRCDKP